MVQCETVTNRRNKNVLFIRSKIEIAERNGENRSLWNSLNLCEEVIVNSDTVTSKMRCECVD